MELDITSSHDEDLCVVRLAGEVDVYTAPKLKEALAAAMDEGCGRIAIDLEGVDFMDSSGLGALVGGLRRAKEASVALVVVGPREQILKVFRITGLDKVFPVFDSIDDVRLQS